MGERVLRIDAGQLRAPVRTPQGFLRVDGYVGRAGIYEYTNDEDDEKAGFGKVGTTRFELRPEEEVFREDTLNGFEGASLTARHPKKMIDLKNVRAFEVGSVSARAQRDGDRVMCSMVIKDERTIADVESKKLTQLSPGHLSEIERTKGFEPKYATKRNPTGRYDCIQRNITINHLALCERARGGTDLAIRMDGISVSEERSDDYSDAVQADAAGVIEEPCEMVVMTTAVDGHQHTLDPADPSGTTSYATADGATDNHRHEWVRAIDGKFVIGENTGHTHEVDTSTIAMREDALKPKDAPADPVPAVPVPAAPVVAVTQAARNDSAAISRRGDRMPEIATEDSAVLKAKLIELEGRATAAEAAVKTQSARADSAEQRERTANERVTERDAKLAAGQAAAETKTSAKLQARVDELEREIVDLRAAIPEQVRKRAEVIAKAKAIFGVGYRTDGLSDQAIQDAIIKKLRPNENLSGIKSDDARAARCDSLFDDRVAAARANDIDREAPADLPTVVTREVRNDSAQPLSFREQWKSGLTTYDAAPKRRKGA